MTNTGVPSSIWPTIGIVTALPKEHAAMKTLLSNPTRLNVEGDEYVYGEIPADRGDTHQVVLVLAAEGENSAAISGTLLLNYFPSIKDVIMTGIAGGVPNPTKPDRHVRLGDIVVSGEGRVVQYDYVTDQSGTTTPRHPPRPPSARLLDAVRLLESEEYQGARPWLGFIDQVTKALHIRRPPATSDLLADTYNPTLTLTHPRDSNRQGSNPRVFRGTIASANRLLKNPVLRDQVRDQFGVKAVEMEASGIADATWTAGSGYLIVRGVCDYCDSAKGDKWQLYAAAVAAGYTRALLASMSVISDPRLPIHDDKPTLYGIPADKALTQNMLEAPTLILRDFTYYGTDPYHPPMEGPYYPDNLLEAPSAAVSFSVASTSQTPIRIQNVYFLIKEAEPLKRATFPVYERGNGAEPILSWVELGGVQGSSRVMTERRSKVGSGLDPADFHVRVFSRAGYRYQVGIEVDWIDIGRQDRTGKHTFPETFLLNIPEFVTWESLVKGATEVKALTDSGGPFLAEALSAMTPAPVFTILVYSHFEPEREWIKRGTNCYLIPPGKERALTLPTGLHLSPYEEGPLQFLLIDGHTLIIQDDNRVDEAVIVQDKTRVAAAQAAFDDLAKHCMLPRT